MALATIVRRFRGWRRAPLVIGAVPVAAATVAIALAARSGTSVEPPIAGVPGSPLDELAVEAAQLRLQRDVEEHLRARATSLLERVVGERQVVVEVHADLDFERVERSVETWDPASRVLRSEQVVGEDGAILASYEIDRNAATVVGATGAVRRLSIAVLVNGLHERQADGTLVWVERTPHELETLSAIVRDAVGWDESRGDTLEMASLRFAESPVAAPSSIAEFGVRAIGLVALVAAAVAGAVAIRGAVAARRARRERRVAPPVRTAEPPRRPAGRERMHALAREHPVEVAQVIRGWLGDERSA